MPSDVVQQFSQLERPSIKKIKEEILERARERHAKVERGECDVPIHYVPLPVATLYDLLGQLEYRCDSLALAVPPLRPGLGNRLKRQIKQMVGKALRWILIRQVEFNTVAVELAREASEQLASSDRNLGELIASVGALKLQVHTLRRRLDCLEANPAESSAQAIESDRPSSEDELSFHQALLPFLKDRGPLLIVQAGQIDLLKFLVSEGLDARAVEAGDEQVEAARERDLPIEQEDALTHLQTFAQGSLDGIFLGHTVPERSAREFSQLLGTAWQRLRPGGLLLVAAGNAACKRSSVTSPPAQDSARIMPVEMLTYVLESHSFWVADMLFWRPLSHNDAPVAQASKGRSFDLKQYSDYLLVGVKG
jgi:hypothetical protein